MKKDKWFILLLLTIILSCGCFFSTETAKASDFDGFVGEEIWREFCALYPDRTAFSQGEKQASEYIAEKFSSYGLQCYFGETYEQVVSYGEIERSQNIVAIKKSSSQNAKSIVVGAHYDNVSISSSSGANDNASGVAVLLALASELADEDFDFDIVFACFGMEELGMLGSQYFVDSLSEVQKKNIMLYINLDSLANGDNLYLYAEDVPTDFARVFYESHNKNQIAIKKINTTIGNSGIYYSYNYYLGRPFSASYFNTDYVSFRNEGIPSVSFFAGNLEYSYGYIESTESSRRVMHSSNDTVHYLDGFTDKNHLKNMQSVFDCICATLSDDEFLSVANNAVGELVDDTYYSLFWSKVIVLLVVVICVLIFVKILRRLRKRAVITEQPIKNFKIFFQPNDEEVFTF